MKPLVNSADAEGTGDQCDVPGSRLGKELSLARRDESGQLGCDLSYQLRWDEQLIRDRNACFKIDRSHTGSSIR